MTSSFDCRWDEARGAAFLEQRGVLTPDVIARGGLEFVPLLERSRARHGYALALVDASAIAPETLGVMADARNTSSGAIKAGDRFALVLPSSLAKAQLNRIGSDTLHYNLFLSRSAAEMWLFAPLAGRRDAA